MFYLQDLIKYYSMDWPWKHLAPFTGFCGANYLTGLPCFTSKDRWNVINYGLDSPHSIRPTCFTSMAWEMVLIMDWTSLTRLRFSPPWPNEMLSITGWIPLTRLLFSPPWPEKWSQLWIGLPLLDSEKPTTSSGPLNIEAPFFFVCFWMVVILPFSFRNSLFIDFLLSQILLKYHFINFLNFRNIIKETFYKYFLFKTNSITSFSFSIF